MLELLEGLERVCRAHSSGILYGVSVDPAVGFEVEAAMGESHSSWYVTVCLL